MTDVAAPKWALDRRIPAWGVVLFVLSVLGSGAGAVAFGAVASERLTAVERKQAEFKDVPERLGRIDERTLQMQKTLDQLAARP